MNGKQVSFTFGFALVALSVTNQSQRRSKLIATKKAPRMPTSSNKLLEMLKMRSGNELLG
jgi:hypothetical protein